MSYLFGGGGGSSNPFASGGTTVNVIPKSNGSSQLVDSALTDNGTIITSTEKFVVPDGSPSSPTFKSASGPAGFSTFNSGVNFGITIDGANNAFVVNSTPVIFGTQFSGVSTGYFGLGSTTAVTIGADTFWTRKAAANWRMGQADLNGTPIAQTISVQNAITGTDLAGSTFTIDAPLGTGLGAGAKTVLNRGLMKATGTTAQTSANAFAICESKTLSNTSATTTALATIALPSNSGGGAYGIITVVATDGTNFDADCQSFNVSYVNKAAAITISTAQITTASPASNSGSTTCGITVTSGASLININVTPVFTTIVPTTVTAYLQLFSNGTGAITAL